VVNYVAIGKRKGYRIESADLTEFIQRRKTGVQPAQPPRRTRQKLKHIRR